MKAVLAESFERIHRSNLVGMGLVPLQFLDGENADTYGLTGHEKFTIHMPLDTLKPGMVVDITTDKNQTLKAKLRFDTDVELTYYRHGGILNYMIRSLSSSS